MSEYNFYLHPRLYLTVLVHNTVTDEIINYNVAKQLNDKYITCTKTKMFDTPHSDNYQLAYGKINELISIYNPQNIFLDKTTTIDDSLLHISATTNIINLPYLHEECHIACSQLENGGVDGVVFSYDGCSSYNNATFLATLENNQIKTKESIPIYFGRIFEIVSYMLDLTPGKLMGFQSYGKFKPKYTSTVLDIIHKCGISYDKMEYMKNYLYIGRKIETLIPNSSAWQDKADFAKTFQTLWTIEVLKAVQSWVGLSDTLSITGGCALNGITNFELLKTGWFDRVHFNPMPDDSGQAIGLYALDNQPKTFNPYCGISINSSDNISYLKQTYSFEYLDDSDLIDRLSNILCDGNIVGHIRGDCEIGPRALGNRSILAAPFRSEIRDKINLHIKDREYWRPFGPMCLWEDANDYFDIPMPSKYMSLVSPVKTDIFKAITHIDNTTRPQTVEDDNPYYYSLLTRFKELSGYSVLLNTSFNQGGYPTLNNLDVASYIFRDTPLDYLVVDNYIFKK